MAKKVDPLKAKAAKQRKMAIGLSVVFVLVLAYQGPKTMKMLKGPSAPAAAPVVTPTAPPPTGTTEAAVPPLGAPAPAAGVPASSAEPAVLSSAEQPLAGPGQLLSFELFESKDPFAQQFDVSGVGVGSNEAGLGSKEPAAGGGTTAGADPNPPAPDSGETKGAGSSTPLRPAPSESEKPAAPAVATTISVNGVSTPVALGAEFPPEDPVLVLVSAASDGKSVKVGIAGGTYADGTDTITLKLGKPLTLQNTADGTRYELVLQTVAGFAPPGPTR